MTESAYSINERATKHCARMTLSNLVWLEYLDTRQDKSNTTSCVNVEPNRNQRCFPWLNRITLSQMPEGSNLMSNQTQAMSTPDNLVGGAVTCEPYLPLVGPKPPCKGGSYARIQHKGSYEYNEY